VQTSAKNLVLCGFGAGPWAFDKRLAQKRGGGSPPLGVCK